MKKLISIILALVMALSLCVTATWAAEPTPTYGWYDDTADTFTLSTMSDYLGFVKLTQGKATDVSTSEITFAGKTVKLQCDVDFAGMDFFKVAADGTIAVDWRTKAFYGIFDAKDESTGKNHTIKNLKYTIEDTTASNAYGMGVFRYVDGTIKNLNVENITVNSTAPTNFGGIVYDADAYSSGTLSPLFDNCHVSNLNLTLTGTSIERWGIGGLACFVGSKRTVQNCTVTNFKLTANCVYKVGGLISTFFIGTDSPNEGLLKNCRVDGFTVNVGALAGHASGPSNTYGDFGGIGGMLGYGHGGNAVFPIEECTVTGANITVGKMYADSFVGGFLGMSRRRYEASDCSAQGTITVNGTDGSGKCFVGGFCGAPTGADTTPMKDWSATEPAVTFTNCAANVNITASDCTTGGFAGLVGGSFQDNGDYSAKNTAKFDNCTASGTINSTGTTTSTGTAGAFTGDDMGRGTYEDNCTAAGATNSGTLNFVGSGTPTQVSKMAKLLFDLTGGTGTTFVVAAEGSVVDLTKYVPTRDGYSFVGWVEGADTTEPLLTEYTMPGGESANETENPDGTATLAETEPSAGKEDPAETEEIKTATLYAVWELIPVEEPPTEDTGASQAPINRQDTAVTTPAAKTDDTTKTDVVTSAKTFDAGVAVYAVMGVLSLTGSAWVAGKKRV